MPRVFHGARLGRPVYDSETSLIGDVEAEHHLRDGLAHGPDVSINRTGRYWSLNTSDGSTTWSGPPAVLGRVMWELFSAQPEDVLHWFHTAAWRMRAEEHEGQLNGTQIPDEMRSSAASTERNLWKQSSSLSWIQQPFNPGSSWHNSGSSSMNAKNVSFYKASDELSKRLSTEMDIFNPSRVEEAVAAPPPLAPCRQQSITGLTIPGGSWREGNRSKGQAPVRELRTLPDGRVVPVSAHSSIVSDVAEEAPRLRPKMTQPTNSKLLESNAMTSERRASSTSSEAADVLACSDIRASAVPNIRESAIGEANRSSMQSMPGVGLHESMQSLSAMKSRMSASAMRSFGSNMVKSITSLFTSGTYSQQHVVAVSSAVSAETLGSTFSYINFRQHFKSVKAMSSSQLMMNAMKQTPSEIAQTWLGISPTSLFSLLWNFIFSVCLAFEMWAVPFDLVFLQECDRPQWLDTADVALLSFFSVDILMSCSTGYVDRGFVVRSWRRILKRYLISLYFIIDLAATAPYAILMDADLKALRLIIFLRLLRLRRVLEWTRSIHRVLDTYFNHPLLALPLFMLQVVLLLVVHIYGILWALVQPDGWDADEVSGAYDKYFECMWWSYTTLTCANAGAATSDGQRAVDMLAAVLRVCLLFGLTLVAHHMVIGAQERVRSQCWRHDMLKYLRVRGISEDMDIYIDQMLRNNDIVQSKEQDVDRLKNQPMSWGIRKQLADELWERRLIAMGLIYPLVMWQIDFASQLAEHVREDNLAPGTVLFSTGELSHSAYLVLFGCLSAVDPVGDKLEDYTRDMWVGEHALVNPELLRSETVTCKDHAALMTVVSNDFRKLVAHNGLADKFENLLQKTLWMGLCGRCGFLGDHFAKDCPLLNKRTWKGILWNALRLRPFRQKRRDDGDQVSPELVRFLQDLDLMRHHAFFADRGINNLTDLCSHRMSVMLEDPDSPFSLEEKKKLDRSMKRFRDKLMFDTSDVLLNSGSADNHLIFISHYKVEAGTEAALMQKDLEKFIEETPGSPGQDLESPVFVDTENLRDLNDLQDYVRRSHNLVLLLTPGILTRPWVLIEIVTAVQEGVNIIPVEIQRPGLRFQYPGDEYYQRLRGGQELGPSEMDLLAGEGIDLIQLEHALQAVFKRIATPFSPHKTAGIRAAELREIMKQCALRQTRPGASRDFKSGTGKSVNMGAADTDAVDRSRSRSAPGFRISFKAVNTGMSGGALPAAAATKTRSLRRQESRDLNKLRRLSTAAMDAMDFDGPADSTGLRSRDATNQRDSMSSFRNSTYSAHADSAEVLLPDSLDQEVDRAQEQASQVPRGSDRRAGSETSKRSTQELARIQEQDQNSATESEARQESRASGVHSDISADFAHKGSQDSTSVCAASIEIVGSTRSLPSKDLHPEVMGASQI